MTPDRDTLISLAERVEALTGPDRELDFLIWAAVNGVSEITWPTEGHPMTPGRGGRVEGRGSDGDWQLYGFIDPGSAERNWQPYGGKDRYPTYTASRDAAASLVPKGWVQRVSQIRFGLWLVQMWRGDKSFRSPPDVEVMAATEANARTAAAIRARAAMMTEEG